MTMRKRINDFFTRFLSLRGTPKEIARATALGAFIGITPTIPFHTALIMIICLLFRQNITAAMMSATVISNPFTIPFFYLAEYELGTYVLGMASNPFAIAKYDIRSILEISLHILYPLQVGGLILGVVLAAPIYFLSHHAVVKLRTRYAKPAEPAP